MVKLVKLFIIFGPIRENQVKILKKYTNTGQSHIDESLMSTLCLPKIEFVNEPTNPKFQTFLVTKEDGQVLYGSGLIVYEKSSDIIRTQDATSRFDSPSRLSQSSTTSSANSTTSSSTNSTLNNNCYVSHCLTIITDTPFIHATKSLLHLIWEKNCDENVIKAVMNIPLPAKRACLRIVRPIPGNKSRFKLLSDHQFIKSKKNSINQIESKAILTKDTKKLSPTRPTNYSHEIDRFLLNSKRQTNCPIDDIYLYRGMSDLPILDYPLRELFTFLRIDDLLLAFTCILMEFRTLIISQDNYKLMMVGEALTTLLLPLRWCNVYVPILPPDYGATYLDAPTSYIMGINTQVTELPDNLNHVQCRIYCDENRVVCDADSLSLPLFLNDIKEDLIKILEQFSISHHSKPFTYLDDLKFNRAIRVLFIKTVRKNLLANYERYIVDVPETSSEIRQFDVVSYLSDQPEFMRAFLSRFLETQLFVSFIDENAKRMQQSWLSIFDMDPEELSEHFTDEALDMAFKNAQRIQLKNLTIDHPEILPQKTFLTKNQFDLSNKRTQRLHQKHVSLDQSETQVRMVPPSPMRRNNHQYNQSVAKGKITELIEEVKDLTKKILIEIMNDSEMGHVCVLIGSLCDLIERVWSHGAFVSTQESNIVCCPLWDHLMTFARLKYIDSNHNRREVADANHLNVLSSVGYKADKTKDLDMMLMQEPNILQSFKWFKLNRRQEMSSLARDLINDVIEINKLEDVKTGVGKARAFIRLSLEKKKLSKHLKTLLSDQPLLISLYKPYAFLLHEDEREQFLMYLLTLNAVDLPCFTTTFINVIKTRRLKTGSASVG